MELYYSNSSNILRAIDTRSHIRNKWKIIGLLEDGIEMRGCPALHDYLTTNPPLEQLFLVQGNVGDEDMALIAVSLEKQTNLRGLLLRDNNGITPRGWGALREAVDSWSSLNSVSDSKHTCEMCVVVDDRIQEVCRPYTVDLRVNHIFQTELTLEVVCCSVRFQKRQFQCYPLELRRRDCCQISLNQFMFTRGMT